MTSIDASKETVAREEQHKVQHEGTPDAVPDYKIPESVLVVIYRDDGQVLLLRRTVAAPEGVDFWQSVTGSKDFASESWLHTAAREVLEETGIDAHAQGCVLRDWELENTYTIYPAWQHKYAPGVWINRERVLGLRVPSYMPVVLNAREHTAHAWHDWREAARRCYSPSNAEAVLLLPRFADLSAAASEGAARNPFL